MNDIDLSPRVVEAGRALQHHWNSDRALPEQEVVVTGTVCGVITLFPAEELPIANRC
jgi:hypothetical protein